MKEKTLESKVLFEGNVLRLLLETVELHDGSKATREIVETGIGVNFLPINEKGEALLIREYRHGPQKIVWRVPGGWMNNTDNNPKQAAQRELSEELGYKAKRMELIFTTNGSGILRQKEYYFLARGLYKPKGHYSLDEGEIVKVCPTTIEKAIGMARKARLDKGSSLLILLSENKIKK